MAKAHVSDSADQASDSDDDSGSASGEVETPRKISARKKISNYERQRMERIEENKARMEAMGLKKMANALQSSVPKQTNKSSGRKGNGKRKVDDEDEEYRPSEEEEGFGSSSAEDEKDGGGDGDDDDEDFDLARTRKKVKRKIQTPKKPASCRKHLDFADDDDEALKQAIALSLQDSAGFTDESNVASQSYSSHPTVNMDNAREGNSHIQEDMGKRKRKKSINSRVQMTEDELIIHFFQFDEAGKGYINLRDLKRIAVTHDFIWHEKEMADMILHFDSDGDGKAKQGYKELPLQAQFLILYQRCRDNNREQLQIWHKPIKSSTYECSMPNILLGALQWMRQVIPISFVYSKYLLSPPPSKHTIQKVP